MRLTLTRTAALQTAMFATAVALPILLVCGIVAWHWASAEQYRHRTATTDIAVRLTGEIDRFIAERILTLQALATSPTLDEADFARFRKQTTQLFDLEGVAIVLRDGNGLQLVDSRAVSEAHPPPRNYAADAVVLATRQPQVSDLLAGRGSAPPHVLITVPVLRDGAVQYLLDAAIYTVAFQDLMRRAGVRAPYFATITGRDGRVIARSPANATAQARPPNGLDERRGEHGVWLGENTEGRTALVEYHRAATSGWIVNLGVPQDVLDEPIRRTIVAVGLSGTVLVILVCLAAWPIVRRMRAAQAVAAMAAASLAEEEERYRTLADCLPQLLWAFDARSGRTAYANAQFRAYYGEMPSERAARVSRNHPDDADRMEAAWMDASSRGVRYEIEGRLRGNDGSYRAHKLVIVPVLRDGTVAEWIGTALDVEDLAQARRGLEDTTGLLRLAQDAAGAGAWEWNPAARTLWLSPASSRTHGLVVLEAGSVMAETAWQSLVHPDDRGQMLAEAARALAHDASYSGQFRICPEGRPTRWLQSFGRVVQDPRGGSPRMVGLHIDVTERKEAEARVEHMALHDALTGLPNRRLFRERLERAIGRAERQEGRHAVLACDLDRFKAVNDTHGHKAGDRLLQIVGERMLAEVGPRGVVARLGGDEFAVVLEDLDRPDGAEAIARRIVTALSEPFRIDGIALEVGASVGGALVPEDGIAADELFKRADTALYEAKAAGRNTHRMFEPAFHERNIRRSQLALDMKEAIRRGDFSLVYQPIVDVAAGAVLGFEALMRWQHPEHGPIPPGEFISVAEDTGLIVPLGTWALSEACREAVTWPESVRVAVNVSMVQFRDGLERAVLAALGRTGLPAHRLKLEVTESVLMKDPEAVVATLERLRVLGVRVALDDFGIGYSSLSYLRRFRFDKIKIDRAFVRDIADPDAAAIVRAVVSLGHSLGMGIVAEGVETEEQLDILRQEGIQEIQGYLVSRPLPADQALCLVDGRSRLAGNGKPSKAAGGV